MDTYLFMLQQYNESHADTGQKIQLILISNIKMGEKFKLCDSDSGMQLTHAW